ncbi:glycoside hydrolase family 31 protein [Ilumatobacter coccineus]|uniref:Putative glycosidase n=1 Tax=Ilumatobacter coccineus (strain NBRC 103263 / KCTC 29153 / YM16-304) TaxID=1313172 RepID=A0A6C7EFT4_ILUCY|nr:TIM-barrel domain-containing protein [Ilumatobacter coccineus]BAN03478.1 putative glycosidase [Ilumatobacter coccineus YM16-304]
MTDLPETPCSIEHHPLGSGHPYRVDPDQRHPVDPIAGERFELRVVAAPTVTAVSCELRHDGTTTRRLMSLAEADELYGDAAHGEGHLAAASGARPELGDRLVYRLELTAPAGAFEYRFADDAGATTDWVATSGARWTSDGGQLDVHGTDRHLGDVEWLMASEGPVRCRFSLSLRSGDHVVGFGERFDVVDQRGEVLDARVFEQYKQQGKRTYLPSPFATVVAESDADDGWGFHVVTSRPTAFDVGATEADRLIVEVDVDPTEPIVRLDVYDGSPRDVIAAHIEAVGALVRPPDWIFRPWMSGNEWNTQERVLAEVERSVDLGIPVGAIVIEAWSDEATFTAFNDAEYDIVSDGAPRRLDDFTFPSDGRWPDPKAMVDRLHELGVKVLLWQIPICPIDRDRDVSPTAAAQVKADAATMIERGYCVREADGTPYHNRGWWFPGGLLPDWTNDDARAWWLAKRRYLLDDLGIDGFKTDGGEHAWGSELRYADGTRGDVSNNRFPNHYAAAYQALLTDCGVDGVTFSRAGFTGAGSVPCHWAGDEDSTWEAFRASIVAGLTAGASGVPFWGWDIAGFSGEIPSVELFVRATAMAAFCPIMQYHSEYNHGRSPSNDRTPWNLAERHGDERAITIYRGFARLRERLLPYLSTEADKTVATGVPLMRPMYFDHLGAEIWNHPTQYLLGDDLLVAPVCWEGSETLDVHLPAGEWIDVWSGAVVTGDRSIAVETPWSRIPVFCAARNADLASRFSGTDSLFSD